MKIRKPKKTVQDLIEEACELPSVTDSTIWTSREETGILSVLESTIDQDTPIIFGEGFTGRCYENGAPTIIDNFDVEFKHQDDPDRKIAIVELVKRRKWKSAFYQTIGSDDICQKIGVFAVYSRKISAFRDDELVQEIVGITNQLKELIFFQTAYDMNRRIGDLKGKLRNFNKLLPDLMAVRFAIGGEIHDSINDLGIAKVLLGDIVTDDTERVRELSHKISSVLSNLRGVNTHREALRDQLSIKKNKLSRLMNIIENRFRHIIEAQNISFVVHEPNFIHDAPSDIFIRADKTRLEQVFHNLIHNSIYHISHDPGRKLKARKNEKSRFQGNIEIRIDVSNTSIVFSVLDDGEGCEEGKLVHVMDEFFSDRGTNSARGTGFGLAIARHYVLAHGGEIGVHSTWGDSFEVRFSLPMT